MHGREFCIRWIIRGWPGSAIGSEQVRLIAGALGCSQWQSLPTLLHSFLICGAQVRRSMTVDNKMCVICYLLAVARNRFSVKQGECRANGP